MQRPPYLLGVLVVAAIVLVVGVLVYPQTKPVSDSFTLTSGQSPGWTERYCIPEDTWFTYTWTATTGTVAHLTVQGPTSQSVLLGSGGSSNTNGSGRYDSDGTMQFQAANVSSPSVQVLIDLSFTLTFSYIGGAPHSGPGAC
jgi:hypothetical protein